MIAIIKEIHRLTVLIKYVLFCAVLVKSGSAKNLQCNETKYDYKEVLR